MGLKMTDPTPKHNFSTSRKNFRRTKVFTGGYDVGLCMNVCMLIYLSVI